VEDQTYSLTSHSKSGVSIDPLTACFCGPVHDCHFTQSNDAW